MTAAEQQIREMAADDLIEPSCSPWRAPVVMARKKDGSLRFCTDFRGLNSVTVTDAHPLPRVDAAVDQLSGSVFFSCLDLSSGYWQVEVNPEDREKTAFSVGKGLWQYKVMAMGLKNAPPTFQRLMELALQGIDWQHVLVYIDDICLFSPSFEHHLVLLRDVFTKLRAANLRLKPSKCQLFQRSVVFLGHKVSDRGIQPDPANVEKVAAWKTPRNTSEVRSFLGLASYYRKFCRNFATIAEPLQHLTESHVKFQWTEECDTSFNLLRRCLTSPPLLVYPDFNQPFRLDCDASKHAIGAVLSQGEGNHEHVVAYASKSLNASQRNWITYDREWWAILWAIRHFRPYLAGRKFTVVTDHKPLVGSANIDPGTDPTGRRARWAIEMSTYDFDLVNRDGSKHTNADALSRVPVATVNTVHDDGNDELRVQQLQDPNIVQLKGWLEQKKRPPVGTVKNQGYDLRKLYDQYDRCSLRDGVVYRRWKPSNKAEWQQQVVLPTSMRKDALQSLHDECGHFSFKKTLNRIRERCYWPRMFTEVKEWCENCVRCQQKRNVVPEMRAPLQPIVTMRPRELVTLDLVEYPVSSDGHRYTLVVIDHFTKYLELYPLADAKATTIADTLVDKYIPRYGAPEQLHSDQGRNLNAKVVIDVCDILQTHKTRTTPFHPQSDGATERVIRTVNTMLSKLVDGNQKDWDRHLGSVVMAYNSAEHESTGFTPYFLEHGREMRLPVDFIAPPSSDSASSHTAYGANVRQKLESAFQSARKNLRSAHRRQKVGYDRWAKERQYQVGDYVWWYDHKTRKGRCQKLNRPWVGPWKIVKKVGDVVYRIQYCGTDPVHVRTRRRVVHHNQIKQCNVSPADHEVARTTLDRPRCGPCRPSSAQHTAQTVSQQLDLQPAGNVVDVEQGNNGDVGDKAIASGDAVVHSGDRPFPSDRGRVTRSGRLSRTSRNPDFEYYD